MAAKTNEEGVRQLGSCYEVLSAAVEFDRKSTRTLKMQRAARKAKQARRQSPAKRSE